jgi:hypothetical protein
VGVTEIRNGNNLEGNILFTRRKIMTRRKNSFASYSKAIVKQDTCGIL